MRTIFSVSGTTILTAIFLLPLGCGFDFYDKTNTEDTPTDSNTDTQDIDASSDATVICTAGVVQCDDADVIECDTSGKTWEITSSCEGDEACNAEAAECKPLTIQPNNGWVDRFSNGLGIQGAWYVYGNSFSTPTPEDIWIEESDGRMCLAGTAGYSAGTRPTAEFQICQSDATQSPPETGYTLGNCPFGDMSDIIGFRVTITGNTIPNGLRAMFIEPGREQNAYVVVGRGTTDAYFSVAQNYYSVPVTDRDYIDRVAFQVPNAVDFDFCISDVTPIRSGQ